MPVILGGGGDLAPRCQPAGPLLAGPPVVPARPLLAELRRQQAPCWPASQPLGASQQAPCWPASKPHAASQQAPCRREGGYYLFLKVASIASGKGLPHFQEPIRNGSPDPRETLRKKVPPKNPSEKGFRTPGTHHNDSYNSNNIKATSR